MFRATVVVRARTGSPLPRLSGGGRQIARTDPSDGAADSPASYKAAAPAEPSERYPACAGVSVGVSPCPRQGHTRSEIGIGVRQARGDPRREGAATAAVPPAYPPGPWWVSQWWVGSWWGRLENSEKPNAPAVRKPGRASRVTTQPLHGRRGKSRCMGRRKQPGIYSVRCPAGPAAAGKRRRLVCVLLHGAWSDAWVWEGFQRFLAGEGYPSLAADLRGHGDQAAQAAQAGEAAQRGRALSATL